jgi:capsular polysaccharide biosynthesis protein
MKLIRRTTRVEHLVLPTKIVEFMSPRTVNPEARRIYSTIAAHCRHVFDRARRDLPRKVYLSRSHWRFSGCASNPLTRRGVKLAGKVLGPAGVSLKSLMNRPVVNEQEVEDLFRSHGFTVIHPGALSYEEQVSIYSQADILAGFSGSAMHNTVFMKEGARAIHLESVYNVRAPQRLCDRLSRIRTDVIEFQGEVIDPAIGASRIDMKHFRDSLQRILSP